MRNEFRRFFLGQAKRVIKIWLDADGYLYLPGVLGQA